jgi:hypothetical protein
MMLRCNKIPGIALLLAAAATAGCGTHAGSFDVDDSPNTKWNNLVALVTFKDRPAQPRPMDPIQCPEIFVLNGSSSDRVFNPGSDSNDALRYQFSINDVARDCRVDNGQISMKAGLDGTVLLGPAGSPGNYTTAIRVLVVREVDQAVVVNKLYRVPASIAGGQTQGPFTLVTEPLNVPMSKAVHDYTVKVGFDSAFIQKKDKSQPAGAQQASNLPQPSSDQPHHHHHHRPASDQPQQ